MRIKMPIFDAPEKMLAFSNGLYVAAALLTVLATLSVVYFGGRVTALKESQLKAYQMDADARIAEANAKAAEANEKAEQERLARVVIEQRLAGRRISKEKRDEMVAILKQAPGSVIVSSLYGVEESRAFAIDIKEVFHDAGWTAILDLTSSSPNPPVGVVCKADLSKRAGLALKTAMRLLPGIQVIETKLTDNKMPLGALPLALERRRKSCVTKVLRELL
jgi:hypothetical protein